MTPNHQRISSVPRAHTSRFLAGFCVLALLALSACGLIPSIGPAPNLYTLTPKSTFDAGLPLVDWQLVVAEPFAARGLDTNRIALHSSPTEIKYYAGARWTDRSPAMVQTLLVESFENTGKILAVGRQAIGLRSDFTLRSELREFQAQYYDCNDIPTISVRLNVKIVKQPRQAIIASKTFSYSQMATGTGLQEVIIAFDDSLGKVLRRVVEWTLLNAK